MKRDTEGSLQHVVSFVLRAGVVVSTSVGVVALAMNLVANGLEKVSYRRFALMDAQDREVHSILLGAVHLRPRSLMMLGLLFLLLTPISRVAVSLLGFIKEKDRVYIAVTAAVLLTLLGSLFLGGATE